MRPGHAWIFVGAAGLVLAVLGQLDAAGPLLAAGITVASSVGLALIAHGGVPLASEAVAFGASRSHGLAAVWARVWVGSDGRQLSMECTSRTIHV